MEALKRLKDHLSSSFTGNVKVYPHSASHGKSPHSGSDFGTEMTVFRKSGGKKRSRRVKKSRSKSRRVKKSKSRRSKKSKSRKSKSRRSKSRNSKSRRH
jgi:tRNA splicing endonuclease